LTDIEAQPETTNTTAAPQATTTNQPPVNDDPDMEPTLICGLTKQASVLAIRVSVTFLAVVLLWVSSLTVAENIVSLGIQGPTTSQVVETWDLVINLAINEYDSYVACVDRQTTYCNQVLNQTLAQLEAQTAQYAQDNSNTVYQNKIASQNCNNNYLKLIYAMNNWTAACPNNNCTIYYDHTKCTQNEIDAVKLTLNDASQVKSQVYVINQQYARSQGVFADNAVSSVQNYSDYNANYFGLTKLAQLNSIVVNVNGLSVNAKLNIQAQVDLSSQLNTMIQCLSVNPATAALCPGGVYDQLKNIQDALVTAYGDAITIATLLYGYGQQYEAQVASVMSNVQSFIDTVYTYGDYQLSGGSEIERLSAALALHDAASAHWQRIR